MAEVMSRTASLSDDGTYRYRLGRRWGEGPHVLWAMLNPSTADASIDDPTIRRCVGFTRSWSFNALEVVNLFAYRATKPVELKRAGWGGVDIVGPDNEQAWREAMVGAHFVVVAWGANGEPSPVLDLLDDCGLPVRCLGRTKKGEPRHPLMLAATTPLEFWR